MQKATQVLARQFQRVEQLFIAIEHERFLRAPLVRDLVEEVHAYLEAERSLFRHLGRLPQLARPSLKLERELESVTAVATDAPAFEVALGKLRALFEAHGVVEESALQASTEDRLSEGALKVLGRYVEAAHAAALRTQRSSAA